MNYRISAILKRLAHGAVTYIEGCVLWALWGWFAEPHGAPHLSAIQWALLLLAWDWLRERHAPECDLDLADRLARAAGVAFGGFLAYRLIA
jgi:hypothetical protein